MVRANKEKKVPVSWTIDENVVKTLKKEAEEENRSVSYVVNEKLKGNLNEK